MVTLTGYSFIANEEDVPKHLLGKVALVTGGSRGIGRGIVERLAAEGALVIVNYVSNVGAAEEVAAAVVTAGGEALTVQADVGDASQVAAMFKTIDGELLIQLRWT